MGSADTRSADSGAGPARCGTLAVSVLVPLAEREPPLILRSITVGRDAALSQIIIGWRLRQEHKLK